MWPSLRAENIRDYRHDFPESLEEDFHEIVRSSGGNEEAVITNMDSSGCVSNHPTQAHRALISGQRDGRVSTCEVLQQVERTRNPFSNEFLHTYLRLTHRPPSWMATSTPSTIRIIQRFDRDLLHWRQNYHRGRQTPQNTQFMMDQARFIHRWVIGTEGLHMRYQERVATVDDIFSTNSRAYGDCIDFLDVFLTLFNRAGGYNLYPVRVRKLSNGEYGEWHHVMGFRLSGRNYLMGEGGVNLHDEGARISYRELAAFYWMEKGKSARTTVDTERYLRIAQELDPNLIVDVEYIRAVRYLNNRNLEQAQESLARALQLVPDDAKLHHLLAQVYVLQNRPHEALREYRLSIQEGVRDFSTYLRVAELCMQTNQRREAITAYRSAIIHAENDDNPRLPQATSQLLILLSEQRETNEELMYQVNGLHRIHFRLGSVDPYQQIAQNLIHQGLYRQARRVTEIGSSYFPNNLKLHELRLQALQALHASREISREAPIVRRLRATEARRLSRTAPVEVDTLDQVISFFSRMIRTLVG